MDETLGEAGRSLSPFVILLIVIALQSLDVLLEKLKKRGSTSSEEIKLREEIKGLLKEANSLSTPSTFAQAAKLRRLAAAKEKELKKTEQEHNNDEQWSLYAKVLLASKAIIYSGLCWKFWSTHVAVVAPHLLQPFGNLLFLYFLYSTTGRHNTLAGADISGQQVLIAKVFQVYSTLSIFCRLCSCEVEMNP
ncbi:hypothetical protein KSP40_PGU007699 [Platanthera guangdongensis]|uniref:Uncharacterized protein n=1 Tax=Platanthera guangdongensis TaxID=2320717 RepID=A0ABR2LR64_9ASPA